MSEGVEVDTGALREEAKVWQGKADQAGHIVQAVQEAYLTSPAFFAGDLLTLLPGIANAKMQAGQYEEFRLFMENLFKGACTEFEQLGAALIKIADEYERTDKAHEVNLQKFYHV